MEAYIVDAVRTAGGKREGALKDWHPADLGAAVLNALVERTGIDGAAIDDVIAGCVGQIGEQAFHIGRNMVMASKLPDSVPAVSHRPPMRKLAAVGPLRRAGGDERHAGHGHRRRRREHDPRPDGHAGHPSDAGGHRHRPVAAVDQGPLRRQRLHPVPRRRDDGQEVRLRPRGARRLRARKPPQGRRRDAGRSVRSRDRPAARQRRHAPHRRRHPLRRVARRLAAA